LNTGIIDDRATAAKLDRSNNATSNSLLENGGTASQVPAAPSTGRFRWQIFRDAITSRAGARSPVRLRRYRCSILAVARFVRTTGPGWAASIAASRSWSCHPNPPGAYCVNSTSYGGSA
jgi:hypothetical protein